MSCPFIYNAPAKVTSNWFAESERSFTTMIGTASIILGITLGFFMPPLFISEYDESVAYTQAELDGFKD